MANITITPKTKAKIITLQAQLGMATQSETITHLVNTITFNHTSQTVKPADPFPNWNSYTVSHAYSEAERAYKDIPFYLDQDTNAYYIDMMKCRQLIGSINAPQVKTAKETGIPLTSLKEIIEEWRYDS